MTTQYIAVMYNVDGQPIGTFHAVDTLVEAEQLLTDTVIVFDHANIETRYMKGGA